MQIARGNCRAPEVDLLGCLSILLFLIWISAIVGFAPSAAQFSDQNQGARGVMIALLE